jgi:hypothetical protein
MFESFNLQEVEEKQKFEESIMLAKMCPVFHKICLGTLCMSFNKGNINAVQRGDPNGQAYINLYKLREPSCSSPFVTGYIEADMIQP